MENVGPDAAKKSFDLLLHSERGMISINGVMFARKFEEPHRATMVRSYVILLSTAGLHFRCQHWTIVSFEATDQCRVQFFVQFFTEKDEGFSPSQADVEYAEEAALRTWSIKMHLYSQWLIDRIVENTGNHLAV